MIVAACVTEKVPVSEPVENLYAHPIDMLLVVPPTSANSVKLAPHVPNTAPAAALEW